jgi:adenylylsulfate kinase
MESHRRAIAKALSWRIVGLFLTVATAWALTRRVDVSASIGLVDSSLKVFAFYFHERAWLRINYGRQMADVAASKGEGI